MSTIGPLPTDVLVRLDFLKEKIDCASAWNDAIREAMQDPDLQELMTQHNVPKKDVRDFLSGRVPKVSP